jgi:hypothetical protein
MQCYELSGQHYDCASSVKRNGFNGRAADHRPNISPVNDKRRLTWCKERRHWPVDNWKRVIWSGIMLYLVEVRLENLSVANSWRTIPASMCNDNSEIWRRWHYSVGVFFMEWTWPSRNTARNSKCRMVQGHLTSCILATVGGQFADDDCLYQHDNAL